MRDCFVTLREGLLTSFVKGYFVKVHCGAMVVQSRALGFSEANLSTISLMLLVYNLNQHKYRVVFCIYPYQYISNAQQYKAYF